MARRSLAWWYAEERRLAARLTKWCERCGGLFEYRYLTDREGRTIERTCLLCGRGDILVTQEHGADNPFYRGYNQ